MAPVLLFRSPAATSAEDEYQKVMNSFRPKNYWCKNERIKQYACENQHIILKHKSLLQQGPGARELSKLCGIRTPSINISPVVQNCGLVNVLGPDALLSALM